MMILQNRSTYKIDASREWSAWLTCIVIGALLYETLTGITILLLPFSIFNQFAVLLHTVIGLLSIIPIGIYNIKHWQARKDGNFNHFQLLGYGSFLVLFICVLSGLVLTVQAALGKQIDALWDFVHIVSGIAFLLFTTIHITMVARRKGSTGQAQNDLLFSKRIFYQRSFLGCGVCLIATFALVCLYPQNRWEQPFPHDYNWRFGTDRPFAPSLARLEYSTWEDDIVNETLGMLEPSKRDPFLAAFDVNERERKGLIHRIEKSLSDSQVSEDVLKTIQPVIHRYTNFIQQNGAIDPNLLAGSNRCGTAGCHEEIYQEWLPSAHRYSSLDHMFQKVQEIMAEETSPEQTRYCAGCHDPISLFGGAKNASNITLGVKGGDEGSSCIVCHSITQTDTQGNADYILTPQEPYIFEKHDQAIAKWFSDFLIRAYPYHHVESYSRPLYKAPEFCGACHKQYIDKEINTDIGRVQGQNQYDSWRKSRWFDESNPGQSITCRECHMPLQDSDDPSSGDPVDTNRSLDDRKHRSHRFIASNQYVPMFHQLPNAELHTQLTEQWLRGEYEIPEIASRWTSGPVVSLEIVSPDSAKPGDIIPIQVILVNNKTGHDFPTGPLDMIESWLEIKVQDSRGQVLYHAGALDNGSEVLDAPLIFKAKGFDRKGELIDRHNLWDLVGAKYKRSLFPGFTDTVHLELLCPSTSRQTTNHFPTRSGLFEVSLSDEALHDDLTVEAILWYRKANATFLKRIYGIDTPMRAPVTAINHAYSKIKIET